MASRFVPPGLLLIKFFIQFGSVKVTFEKKIEQLVVEQVQFQFDSLHEQALLSGFRAPTQDKQYSTSSGVSVKLNRCRICLNFEAMISFRCPRSTRFKFLFAIKLLMTFENNSLLLTAVYSQPIQIVLASRQSEEAKTIQIISIKLHLALKLIFLRFKTNISITIAIYVWFSLSNTLIIFMG